MKSLGLGARLSVIIGASAVAAAVLLAASELLQAESPRQASAPAAMMSVRLDPTTAIQFTPFSMRLSPVSLAAFFLLRLRGRRLAL